jgi:hypothetical protein
MGLSWHEWASLKREWNERFKGPRVPKKAQFTHEQIEYNVFLFDELLKGPKSLKISLTFRFDKLWHLSKSVHTGEYSQILTSDKCQVSNKKYILFLLLIQNKIQTSKRICSCLNQENISSTLRTTHQQRSSFPLIRLASKKKTGTVRKSSVRFY